MHLLHQLLKLLRGQLVEDTAQTLKQLLSLDVFRVIFIHFLGTAAASGLLGRRLPGLLGLVELHVVAERRAADDFPGLFPLTLLGATCSRRLNGGEGLSQSEKKKHIQRNYLNYDEKTDNNSPQNREEEDSLTGPRGPPTDRLPRFPKYEGVKSGPTFISLAGSGGLSGVLFAWIQKNK